MNTSQADPASQPARDCRRDYYDDDCNLTTACRVCGSPSTGIHYGVPTCEGCKGFFKRSIPKCQHYKCYFGGDCEISKETRNRCKSCRFQRCLQVGMALEAVKMGRIPKGEKERMLKATEAADKRGPRSLKVIAPAPPPPSRGIVLPGGRPGQVYTISNGGPRLPHDPNMTRSVQHLRLGPAQIHSLYSSSATNAQSSSILLTPVNDQSFSIHSSGPVSGQQLHNLYVSPGQNNNGFSLQLTAPRPTSWCGPTHCQSESSQLTTATVNWVSANNHTQQQLPRPPLEPRRSLDSQIGCLVSNKIEQCMTTRASPARPVNSWSPSGMFESEQQEKQGSSGMTGSTRQLQSDMSQYKQYVESLAHQSSSSSPTSSSTSRTKDSGLGSSRCDSAFTSCTSSEHDMCEDSHNVPMITENSSGPLASSLTADAEKAEQEELEAAVIAIEAAGKEVYGAKTAQSVEFMVKMWQDGRLQGTYDVTPDPNITVLQIRDLLKTDIDELVASIVSFATRIPKMSDLDKDDFGILLNSCVFEMWMLQDAAFLVNNESYILFESTKSTLPVHYSMYWMKQFLPEVMIEGMMKFADEMNSYQFSITELHILKALVVTRPQREGLKNMAAVAELHGFLRRVLYTVFKRRTICPASEMMEKVDTLLPKLAAVDVLHKRCIAPINLDKESGWKVEEF